MSFSCSSFQPTYITVLPGKAAMRALFDPMHELRGRSFPGNEVVPSPGRELSDVEPQDLVGDGVPLVDVEEQPPVAVVVPDRLLDVAQRSSSSPVVLGARLMRTMIAAGLDAGKDVPWWAGMTPDVSLPPLQGVQAVSQRGAAAVNACRCSTCDENLAVTFSRRPGRD